MVMLQAV